METPFLLAYLERKAGDATSPHRDLLWKYYIHHRQFAAAAKRLAQRAEADECVCGARMSLAYTPARSSLGACGHSPPTAQR